MFKDYNYKYRVAYVLADDFGMKTFILNISKYHAKMCLKCLTTRNKKGKKQEEYGNIFEMQADNTRI